MGNQAQTRVSRELETRETAKRPTAWKPPELLPAPNPMPGFGFRYIRVSTLNAADPINISTKRREGWEPCKASEHPELQMYLDPSQASNDTVVIGGLMLCKAPLELLEQRDAYYRKQAEGQMESVDNSLMRQNDARMPLFSERKSTTSFGKGE
jgi:hypothetical protein